MNEKYRKFAWLLCAFVCLGIGRSTSCLAQDLTKEAALEKLRLVEEHFQKIRQKCCVLVRGELTNDDPKASRSVTLLLDTIYASDTERKAKRHDVGFGGDLLDGVAESDWQWNRTLKVNGQAEVRLQGNETGGISDNKETLFLSLFDPLCFTVASFGDLVSRRLDEAWFANTFAKGEFAEGQENRNGDFLVTVFTAKNKSVAATLLLSKKTNFLPVHCEVYKNAAEDVSKQLKRGVMFGETDTTWQLVGKSWVPKLVRIKKPKDTAGKSSISEFQCTWYLGDFDSSLLFDESLMRSRWDNLDSLWNDLDPQPTKSK